MRYCPVCNGKLYEIDNCGTEACEKCGTIFKVQVMETKVGESFQPVEPTVTYSKYK